MTFTTPRMYLQHLQGSMRYVRHLQSQRNSPKYQQKKISYLQLVVDVLDMKFLCVPPGWSSLIDKNIF